MNDSQSDAQCEAPPWEDLEINRRETTHWAKAAGEAVRVPSRVGTEKELSEFEVTRGLVTGNYSIFTWGLPD